MHILCMGSKFCVKFPKGTFEISHKILNRRPQNMHLTLFYFLRVSYDIFELWRHKP